MMMMMMTMMMKRIKKNIIQVYVTHSTEMDEWTMGGRVRKIKVW